jgi:glucose/arabinose dehydrogenase
MSRRWLVLALALTACRDTPTEPIDEAPLPAALRLAEVGRGLEAPVYVTNAGDDRLFVVEQVGRIRIVRNGVLEATPFLDLTGIVTAGGERGLLSVAFHPDYATNGFLYVNYTDSAGDTQITRYHATGDVAEPGSAKPILHIDQPFSNHNGGLLLFGPDGLLYVGMGDGGSGGDPQGHGQNPNTLLGAMLRLDVDHGDPYAIPAGNPFAAGGGAAEVWATGLRNPWRFSIDAPTNTLIIADVGQGEWEEITAVPLSSAGVNYGWNIMEGKHCFATTPCTSTGLTQPVHEYSHDDGCSVTGGYVYRGTVIPGLAGTYFYSDYCGGWLRSFRLVSGQATEHHEWDVADVGNITSFGVDSAGELYVTAAGKVYRIEMVETTQQ